MELQLENDPTKSIYNCIHEVRNKLGGVITHLIIPPNYRDFMYDMYKSLEEEKDFYFFGYYNQFRFRVHVDKSLVNELYLVCNDGIVKIKVLDGPRSEPNDGMGTSGRDNEVKDGNPNPP